jgi:hypothetical protein
MTTLSDLPRRTERQHFNVAPLRSAYFLLVAVLFALTLVRAIWNAVALWSHLDSHLKIFSVILIVTMHAPLALMLTTHERIREGLAGTAPDIKAAIARVQLFTAGISYFLLFLSLEITHRLFAR